MNATKKIVETAHNQIVRRFVNNNTSKTYEDELYYLLHEYNNVEFNKAGLFIGNVHYTTFLKLNNICK